MKSGATRKIVETINEKCKVCYTCVRECPAKAIKIQNGQAEVMAEKCIGCGNCVLVCSQNAKKVYDSTEKVFEILKQEGKKAAIIAPSFPAEYGYKNIGKIISALRKIGFTSVHEVAFGADLVAIKYKELIEKNKNKSYIATSCPGIVLYIEKYFPGLVKNLIPVVSPMIATARVLKKIYGNKIKIVFIGPCISKKGEIIRKDLLGSVDEALTFKELKEIFFQFNIRFNNLPFSTFDEPMGGEGGLFPISRGIFQAAKINEDLIEGKVINADGRVNFPEAIREFNSGCMDLKILELLCCEGCIMGPGFSTVVPLYKRRQLVSEYMKTKFSNFNHDRWNEHIKKYKGLDLNCSFKKEILENKIPEEIEIDLVLKELGKNKPEEELNCGACGYNTCREHAIAICKGYAEEEMCLPYTIEKLKISINELRLSNKEIKIVKNTLDHMEKLAHMGQIAAGVAHEINNPLGIILMYAKIFYDSIRENNEERNELKIIVEQAERCRKIVAELLNFSRQNKVIREKVDMKFLIEHCLEAMKIPEGIRYQVNIETEDVYAEVDKEQLTQVLINLINNSIDAMEKGFVKITISGDEQSLSVSVKDEGKGIPDNIKDKIFDPFFTTKQMGKGTGLGLAVTYGIIKMHEGKIEIKSNSDKKTGPTFTNVIIDLPRREHAAFEINEPELLEEVSCE